MARVNSHGDRCRQHRDEKSDGELDGEEEDETGLSLLLRWEIVQPIYMMMKWLMERETDDTGGGKLLERR